MDMSNNSEPAYCPPNGITPAMIGAVEQIGERGAKLKNRVALFAEVDEKFVLAEDNQIADTIAIEVAGFNVVGFGST